MGLDRPSGRDRVELGQVPLKAPPATVVKTVDCAPGMTRPRSDLAGHEPCHVAQNDNLPLISGHRAERGANRLDAVAVPPRWWLRGVRVFGRRRADAELLPTSIAP